MSKEIQIFKNEKLNLQMRTIQNEDGNICVNSEDTAIGFGWYQEKNGVKYPKWERINGFITELGFSPQVGKDDYIPESLFYLLGMKANNKVAKEFQKWLAVDVIPSIRRTGCYNQAKKLTPMDQLKLQYQVLDEHEQKIDILTEDVKEIKERMTIETGKQKVLCDLVSKKVTAILGGKDTPAYKELNKKAFSKCWHDFKNILNVASYKDTPIKDFEVAKQTIIDWEPNRELELMIRGCNAQIRI